MSKNKKKAVRILTGFFIVMAVCTVISRAASSLLVAQVKVERVKRGRLSYTYEGAVKMVPEKEEQIFLWPGQQVENAAKAGSTVKAGECLVQYRAEYLEKAADKKTGELEQLRLRREQQKITAQGNGRVPAAVSAAYALQSAQDRLADAMQREFDAQAACDEAESGVGAGTEVPEESLESGAGLGAEERSESGTADHSFAQSPEQELHQSLQSAQAETEAAWQAVKDAQNAYDIACQQDEVQNTNDANSRAAAELGVKELDIQIQQTEKELGVLQDYQAAGARICAKQDCVVVQSPIQPGAVTAGSEVLVIGTGGWRLKGTISAEDTEAITAGTEVEISESQTETYKVRIESVVLNSSGNERDANVVSGSGGQLDGGGNSGTGEAFWYAPLPEGRDGAGQKSFTWKAKAETEEEYEQIIPLTALREEAGGNYCLVLEEKSSALGTVQTAKKVPVTVLKKDSENAAVTAGLTREDQMIVSSEKYVEEGDQVRIKESGN